MGGRGKKEARRKKTEGDKEQRAAEKDKGPV